MSEVDYVATFHREAKALGPIALGSVDEIMDSLQQRCLDANSSVKSDTDEVKSDLESEANRGDDSDPDDWEILLDDKIDMIKARSADRWEDLRTFGKNRIRELPQRLRPSAARAYGGSLNAVARFVDNSIRWLTGALDTVAEWIKQAWEKIKEWASATENWVEETYNTIHGWFGAYVDRFGEPCSPRPSSTTTVPLRSTKGLPDLESITARLEKVGLDRFLLVKKGDEWVVQLSL